MHQIDLDVVAGRPGLCDQCGFKALLFRKPKPVINTLEPQDMVDDLTIQSLCPTCFDTPLGTQSLNQRHRKHDV